MPVYEIETPDGRRFEVDAPDQQAAKNAAMQQARSAPLQGQGMFYPMSWDVDPETGQRTNRRLDMGNESLVSQAYQALVSGATLPGDVASGKASVGPIGRPSAATEAINRSAEAAAFATPAARGATALRRGMPTGEQLRQAGRQGYRESAQMGVQYNPQAIAGMADRVERELLEQGIVRQDAPRTYAALDDLKLGRSYQPTDSSLPGQVLPATAQNFRILKDRLSDARVPTQTYTPSDKERLGAERLIRELNDFVENPSPSSVVAGPAAAAGQLQQMARENLAAGKRSETITSKLSKAELEAAAANSGQNMGNRARAKALQIVNPEQPHRRFGFKPDEIAALEGVVRGSASANRARNLSNRLGGGGGGVSTLVGGGTTGGLYAAGLDPITAATIGLGAMGTGMGARALSNRLSRQALEGVDEMIRARSPMGQAAARSPVVSGPPTMANVAPLRMGTAATIAGSAPAPNPDLLRELLIRAAQRRGEQVL